MEEIIVPKQEEILMKMINDPYVYAAIYARESNPNVKTALETQVLTCEEHALEKNLIVYDIYQEFASASARATKERTEFKRLIQDARKGRFKKIIVTKRDRLARKFEHYIEIKRVFKELDIEILFSNDVQLLKTNDYAANFIDNMMMAVAEIEPDNIRDRIILGMKKKWEMGIYDKKGPYGLKKPPNSDKYQKVGIQGEIVKDIFNIYLENEDVKYSEQVVERLNEKAESLEGEHKEKYLNELKKANKAFIEKIICKPTYAGLQTKKFEHRYEIFRITYKDEVLDINLDFFNPCENIDRIIFPEKWYEAATKWIRFNPIEQNIEQNEEKKKKEKVKENKLLKEILYCKKCGKDLKLKSNNFSCGIRSCTNISKDMLIKESVEAILLWLANNGKYKRYIIDVVKILKSDRKKLKSELLRNLNNMSTKIEEYVSTESKEEKSKEISVLVDSQLVIKKELDDVEKKISFLNGDFKSAIMTLIKSGYISVVAEEIEENHSALLEMFVLNEIKEIKVGECIIGVKESKKHR